MDQGGDGRSAERRNHHQDVLYQRRIHFQFKNILLCVSDYSNCFGISHILQISWKICIASWKIYFLKYQENEAASFDRVLSSIETV